MSFQRQVLDVMAAGEFWSIMPDVRWWTDLPQKPPVLQQAWRSSNGDIKWSDVPTVLEPTP